MEESRFLRGRDIKRQLPRVVISYFNVATDKEAAEILNTYFEAVAVTEAHKSSFLLQWKTNALLRQKTLSVDHCILLERLERVVVVDNSHCSLHISANATNDLLQTTELRKTVVVLDKVQSFVNTLFVFHAVTAAIVDSTIFLVRWSIYNWIVNSQLVA